MGWAITADPQRFDEAISWLMQRAVITAEEAARLDHESRQRAFWVGGGLQLKQIQQVFDALNDAIAKGEPFADFKRRMARTLRDPVHAETVFRNAAQRAYNAGRYRQMREVERWRPFWKFDAILDSRTSSVCRARDGVTLHASSSWWRTNWPPLHHRCRSTVRSVRMGSVTTLPPNLPGTPGWGLTPDNDPVWKPDPNKHDAALLRELERKETTPRPKKVKTKPEHDPKHWAKEYDHLGEAGPAAAYGRAMAERALDRPAKEVIAELKRLQDAGHPALFERRVNLAAGAWEFTPLDIDAQLGRPRADSTLRSGSFGHANRGLLALSEHTRTIKAGEPLNLAGGNAETQKATGFYALTLDRAVTRPKGWRFNTTDNERSTADNVKRQVNLRRGAKHDVAVHELAHAIEFSDLRALRRSVAFMLGRTPGEKLEKLSKLTQRSSYRDNEVARPDKFLEPYIGKDYSVFGGDHYATEVTAMGYQWMATDFSTLQWLSNGDPEMLFFLLGQLAGK